MISQMLFPVSYITEEVFMRNNIPHYTNATAAWLNTLKYILQKGDYIGPRGKHTIEVLDNCFSFNMIDPVVNSPVRRLNTKFMCAEAEWITRGSNKVEDLVKYNSQMAKFSDDGVILSGAYGLPYMDQFDSVVESLEKDLDTRQAAMTIWKPNPPSSKDIPCTVAMVFNVRNGRFNTHVFMRSSDAWLGLPYDIFSFAMMSMKILCELNLRLRRDQPYGPTILSLMPGEMHLKLVSSHLYEEHFESAREVIIEEYGLGIFSEPNWMPSMCWTNWELTQNYLLSFMELDFPRTTPFSWTLPLIKP